MPDATNRTPVIASVLPRDKRITARDCAYRGFTTHPLDPERAGRIAKEQLKEQLDSPLMWLTLGVLLMQLVYYAIRIWSELNLASEQDLMRSPDWDTPFGL